MKKKILYGLLIILFIGGLFFGLRHSYGLFTLYNFWTAQRDIKIGKIRFLELDQQPLNYMTKQRLAKKYGFEIVYFDCCETPIEIFTGSEFYNREMIEFLENKYDKGWWSKFQAQLDSIDKFKPIDSEVLVCDLVDKLKIVDSLSNNHSNILFYPVLHDSLKNIYIVRVIDDKGIEYFNFFVDANAMKIINLSGKLE